MELYAMREGNSLVPADAESAAVLSKFRMGKIIRVEAKQSRSGPRHRLFWVLCTRIANAVDADVDTVADTLKIETGHCTMVRTKTHGVIPLPRSISYAKMDDAQHKDFLERCIKAIYENWAISRPDILREISDILTPTELRA